MLWNGAKNTAASSVDAQFSWLETQMQSAAINGDSVLIAMHVPFGNMIQNPSPGPVNYLQPSYNDRFLAIINKYNNIIIGMVGGHEHLVELKVLTKYATPVNFLINVPALATYSGNAPGFNTVYFTRPNSSNWIITDYDVFHFTGTNPGQTLAKLYTFRDAYCGDYQSTGVLDCLQHLSASKIEDITGSYHTGNPNFILSLYYPDNIFTALPVDSGESSVSSMLIPIIISIVGVATATAFVVHKAKTHITPSKN
jgi:hypothetical protein